MPTIKSRAILAKPFDIDAALALLADGVQTEGETQQKLYQKTTATWRNKPDHELEFSSDKQEIKATNITDNRIYFFLHEGTKVRYAILSPDWKSKTTPRRLSSGQGRGRVIFISKKFPQPGIKAREWTDVIIRQRKRPYKKNMQSIMGTIAREHNRQRQAA
jgi:hypothetical protein